MNKKLTAATSSVPSTQAINVVVSTYNASTQSRPAATTDSSSVVDLTKTGNVSLIDTTNSSVNAILPRSSLALSGIVVAKVDASANTVTLHARGGDTLEGNTTISTRYAHVTAYPVLGGWIVL